MHRRDSKPQSQQANGRRDHALDRVANGIVKYFIMKSPKTVLEWGIKLYVVYVILKRRILTTRRHG